MLKGRHIFLIDGVDKDAMHQRARRLIADELETVVSLHTHPYNVANGECNGDCTVYKREVSNHDDQISAQAGTT